MIVDKSDWTRQKQRKQDEADAHEERRRRERRARMEEEELFNADPNCKHNVVDAPGGGIKCTKCTGWFCY